jgi:hypothetical protein
MIRTQVYLSPAQHRALKREAKAAGISMTELVRQIVADRVEGRQFLHVHDKRPAFDSHFRIYRFGAGRKLAFRIVH